MGRACQAAHAWQTYVGLLQITFIFIITNVVISKYVKLTSLRLYYLLKISLNLILASNGLLRHTDNRSIIDVP